MSMNHTIVVFLLIFLLLLWVWDPGLALEPLFWDSSNELGRQIKPVSLRQHNIFLGDPFSKAAVTTSTLYRLPAQVRHRLH